MTEADNYLPPDNFQETPRPLVAHRTSPTNIGLYLLSVTAAQDMGWIGVAEAVTRLEQTLHTLHRMPRRRGHLHNWHDTRDLRVLDPEYFSSLDSGNLAGHLISVAQACGAMQSGGNRADAQARTQAGAPYARLLALACDRSPALAAALIRMADAPLDMDLAQAAVVLTGVEGANPDALYWTQAVVNCLISHAGATVPVDQLAAVSDAGVPDLGAPGFIRPAVPMAFAISCKTAWL